MHAPPILAARCSLRPSRAPRGGFTLVELLVVMAVIGTLIGITLPAVQRVRESSRRTQCQSNLKSMGVALTAFEASKRAFPPGDDAFTLRYHAWSSFILPFLDEDTVSRRIDYRKTWNAPGGNDVISDASLPVYVCPTGIVSFAGKQDYGGVLGSAIPSSTTGKLHPDWEHSGILYATDARHRQPAKAAMVIDGLSKTLIVTEGVDRGVAGTDTESQIGNSRWSCGTNCFLHNSRVINTPDVDGFRSNHLGGVNALFADGRVLFLVDDVAPDVVLAMCTKDGREVVSAEGS
jgi:prepilin-type N-terminal cleavage/methylation domain-containing protein/prepilin-type processing-associated H-X9-DG protein